jgi:biopolymer transport protein ExbB
VGGCLGATPGRFSQTYPHHLWRTPRSQEIPGLRNWCLPKPACGRYISVVVFIVEWDSVLAIIEAAGWPIWPLILASVIAVAIIIERAYSLRTLEVAPDNLLLETIKVYQERGVTPELITRLADGSPLGRIFATALKNAHNSREIMKESIEEAGRAVTHELDRFLTSLGTIASMAPLLGLLGTVIGMIEIFGAQTGGGTNPGQLAHGISIALYNTAFGLIVAIPAMAFYRHFRRKIEALVVDMEQQAIKLVEIVHGDRR